MIKFSKPGRLVLMLTDRYAEKKALLIKANEEKTKVKKCLIGYDYIFPKGLVVRIQRYPRKFTKRMGQKQKSKRTILKIFIKQLNLNHIMPTTRLGMILQLKQIQIRRINIERSKGQNRESKGIRIEEC
ncbi:unnamed protein product [Paramecium sonneborni]|uniref:Ribosomal protein L27 n=1 Tax=Paramecium sonneborni TaxID=65129 RepID=A0A8S1KWB3_9CILI|nr:unnamed protein product [Paramecium sonneborni]